MRITAKLTDETPNTVNLLIEDDIGMVRKKTVKLSEFKAVIALSNGVDDMVNLGELPNGYYNGFVSAANSLSFGLVIVIPAGIRPLYYYKETYLIPFPTLAFRFIVKNGNITDSNLFALQTSKPDDSSKLYAYPFGNVYVDGKICWGSNILERLPSKKAIDRIVALFLGSETNNDLFNHDKYKTQKELLQKILEKKSYPLEYLVRNKTYQNIGELVESIAK